MNSMFPLVAGFSLLVSLMASPAYAKKDSQPPPIANALADPSYNVQTENCSHLTGPMGVCDRKPHVVFFVHGLTGKDATFHELHKALVKTYEGRKNLKVYSIDYPTAPKQYDFLGLNKKNSDHKKYMGKIEDRVANLHPLHFAKIMNTKIIDYLYRTEIKNIQECNDKHASNPDELKLCLENRVTMDTEYSLVVHSQGGLASMSYLNTCLKPKYQKRLPVL